MFEALKNNSENSGETDGVATGDNDTNMVKDEDQLLELFDD